MTTDRTNTEAVTIPKSLDVVKEMKLIRVIVNYRGWLLLLFIGGIYPFSPEREARGLWIYGWLLITYLVYRIALEVLSRIKREFYDTTGFRMARIQFMVLFGSALLFETGGIESYFWPIYLWPLFASTIYFSSWTVIGIIYIEVAVLYSLTSLITIGVVVSTNFALLLTNLITLFVLAMVLYYLNARFLKQIRILLALYEVGKEIISELDLDSTLQLIAEKVRELTGCERSLVLLINEHTEKVTAKGCGYPEDYLDGFTLQEIRDGVSGWILETKKSILIPDVQKDPQWTGLAQDSAREFKAKSLVVVPLLISDQDDPSSKKVIGILTAINIKGSTLLTQDDLDIVKRLADLAVIAVTNAKLLEETKKQVEEMAFANKMGKLLSDTKDIMEIPRLLMEKALEEFNTVASSLALINPETREIEFQFALDYTGTKKTDQIMKGYKMPLDKGIAGAVVQSGNAIISNNVQIDARWNAEVDVITGFVSKSILAVPLIYNDQVIGVIEILNKRDGSPFLEREKALLSTVASSAAIAIENARLFNRTQEQMQQERALRREAEVLRRAFEAMRASLDLKEVAGEILDELRGVIEYRTASLQLIQGNNRQLLAGRGFDMKTANPWLLRSISDDPIVNRIIVNKEPLILSEPSEDPGWTPMADVRSWIGLPLVYDQKTIGLLTLDHDQSGFYTQEKRDLLVQFADTAAVDLQKAHLFDIAQQRIRDLEVINEIGQVISTKLDIQDLLQTIVSQIANLLRCTHCTIFFPRRENGHILLVPQQAYGEHSEKISTRSFKSYEGLVGWVFQHGTSLAIENAAQHPHFAPARERKDQPRSMLVVPVKVGDRIIGVISADRDEFSDFSESDQRLVDALALQAGIAIERSRGLELLQDIGNRINRITEPHKMGDILRRIVSGAIKLTETNSGVIYLIGEDRQSIVDSFHPPDYDHPQPRMNRKDGLTRQVIETGEAQLILDIRKDPRVNPLLHDRFRSMIAVPLKIERKVIGVLYLNDENSHDFTPTEVSLLLTLCSQAAVAIENTKLFEELETLYKQLETLSFKIIDLINATTFSELSSKSLEIMSHILNADAAMYVCQKNNPEALDLEDCVPEDFRLRLKTTYRSGETPFISGFQIQGKYVLQKATRSRKGRLEGLVIVQRVGTSRQPAEPFSKGDNTILDLATTAIGHALQRLRRSWDIEKSE